MIDTKKYSAQKRKARKKKAIKTLKSYEGKETSIEKKVRELLTREGLYFSQEFSVNEEIKGRKYYKVYDFYVAGTNSKGNQFNFLIECDGSYWHCQDYLEGTIPYSKLSKTQKKNFKNDKLKNQIAKKIGLPLLRLKETDIKFDIIKVQRDIYSIINKF